MAAKRKKYRILSFDGGPSSLLYLRVLRNIVEELLAEMGDDYPGFLLQSDMFAGTSAGALTSYYFSNHLKDAHPQDELQVIDGMIDFMKSIIKVLSFDADAIFRVVSGTGAAIPTQQFRGLYRDFLGDELVGSLDIPVLSVGYCLSPPPHPQILFSCDPRFKDVSVVEAAIRSGSFPMLVPVFQQCVDGGVTANSPAVVAISRLKEWSRFAPPPVSSLHLKDIMAVSWGGVDPGYSMLGEAPLKKEFQGNWGWQGWAGPHWMALLSQVLEGGLDTSNTKNIKDMQNDIVASSYSNLLGVSVMLNGMGQIVTQECCSLLEPDHFLRIAPMFQSSAGDVMTSFFTGTSSRLPADEMATMWASGVTQLGGNNTKTNMERALEWIHTSWFRDQSPPLRRSYFSAMFKKCLPHIESQTQPILASTWYPISLSNPNTQELDKIINPLDSAAGIATAAIPELNTQHFRVVLSEGGLGLSVSSRMLAEMNQVITEKEKSEYKGGKLTGFVSQTSLLAGTGEGTVANIYLLLGYDALVQKLPKHTLPTMEQEQALLEALPAFVDGLLEITTHIDVAQWFRQTMEHSSEHALEMPDTLKKYLTREFTAISPTLPNLNELLKRTNKLLVMSSRKLCIFCNPMQPNADFEKVAELPLVDAVLRCVTLPTSPPTSSRSFWEDALPNNKDNLWTPWWLKRLCQSNLTSSQQEALSVINIRTLVLSGGIFDTSGQQNPEYLQQMKTRANEVLSVFQDQPKGSSQTKSGPGSFLRKRVEKIRGDLTEFLSLKSTRTLFRGLEWLYSTIDLGKGKHLSIEVFTAMTEALLQKFLHGPVMPLSLKTMPLWQHNFLVLDPPLPYTHTQHLRGVQQRPTSSCNTTCGLDRRCMETL